MKKIKPNEMIGVSLLVAMTLMCIRTILHPSLSNFLPMAIAGLASMVFLSYWGITTFNNKFK